MIYFEDKYFQKINFTKTQKEKYFAVAKRDLGIAQKSEIPEVIFKFTYDALIKFGIFLISQKGYKVRSIQGHHIKILDKISEILKNEDATVIGNKMRQDRNHDFYDGGMAVSEKESEEYLKFVKNLFKSMNSF